MAHSSIGFVLKPGLKLRLRLKRRILRTGKLVSFSCHKELGPRPRIIRQNISIERPKVRHLTLKRQDRRRDDDEHRGIQASSHPGIPTSRLVEGVRLTNETK
ncbi:GM23889 [Drosophila sechellia]|uniref:GM23889 n=1 Tax=Drosophila sechellia TaxID=7238 RepID=B4HIS5_DROSE|nr:GM23889 [Drosophila sechellia]